MSVAAAEKQMLQKQFWKFSLIILLLPLGPNCSSLVTLFGDFFILHYYSGYLPSLDFQNFEKKRMDTSLWHTSTALRIS